MYLELVDGIDGRGETCVRAEHLASDGCSQREVVEHLHELEPHLDIPE